MKKLGLILCVMLVSVFAFSGIAYAENWYALYDKTHYGFSVATDSCASCHVAHTAVSAKLLRSGRTQTDLCYSCHGHPAMSPYDVEDGLIKGSDSVKRNSTAGKFGFYAGTEVTSRHNVDTPEVNSSALAANAIPGNYLGNGNNGFPNGFKCGTCHDVHAGDAANDRLLKTKIWDVQTPLSDVVNFVYNGTTLVVEKYAVTTSEVSAINGYCGLCHSKFNVADDAGKQLVNDTMQSVSGATYYRHALGVSIAAGSSPTLAPYLGNRDDGASGDGKNVVLCLTCHYAHGTTTRAVPAPAGNWKRDPDAAEVDASASSVLLRMDGRGVCFDCHGAASKNLESYGQTNN